jgi:hypothetical protein
LENQCFNIEKLKNLEVRPVGGFDRSMYDLIPIYHEIQAASLRLEQIRRKKQI